jgi:hypothetical protein
MNRIYELYIQTAAASKVGGPSEVGPRRHQVPIKGGGLFFGHYTQADLDKVALRLNQRPRETLGFQTPAVKLRASVALTH